MIDGTVVAHKMGPTMLRHLQKTQYLDYWQSKTGAGAWADNVDIEGHAAACRRARNGNPQRPSCAQYKGMHLVGRTRYPTFDVAHLRNHRYSPMVFASEQAWTREVIDTWLVSCEEEMATTVATALSDAGTPVSVKSFKGATQSGRKPSEQRPSRTAKRTSQVNTYGRQSENGEGTLTSR